MIILYLIDIDLDKTSGVATKICAQSKIWIECGHEVHLLSLKSLSFFDIKGNRISKVKLVRKKDSKISFLLNLYKSSLILKKILSNIDFDVVYMRYRPYDYFFKSAIKFKPVIAEMNTVYEKETKLRSLSAYIYYSIFKKVSFNNMDGFVCVSKEINEITLNNKYNSIIIANGIDMNKYTITKHHINHKAQVVFIGSPNQKWHGVDKFIYLSSKLIEYDFHIIGSNGENTKNLYYHGYLDENNAVKLLKKYDIGISSTAMHRLSMQEASPLKSRQYLAVGLPIIYAYEDTDIESEYSYPFTLQLPNNEKNVEDNIQNIKIFIDKVFNDILIRNEARKFAQKYFDVRKKERKRLVFIEQVLFNSKR